MSTADKCMKKQLVRHKHCDICQHSTNGPMWNGKVRENFCVTLAISALIQGRDAAVSSRDNLSARRMLAIPTQYVPRPERRMLSGHPGRFSAKMSNVPCLGPVKWYLEKPAGWISHASHCVTCLFMYMKAWVHVSKTWYYKYIKRSCPIGICRKEYSGHFLWGKPADTSAIQAFLFFFWYSKNPSNSDMDYRIFHVHVWSFCLHIHMGRPQFTVSSKGLLCVQSLHRIWTLGKPGLRWHTKSRTKQSPIHGVTTRDHAGSLLLRENSHPSMWWPPEIMLDHCFWEKTVTHPCGDHPRSCWIAAFERKSSCCALPTPPYIDEHAQALARKNWKLPSTGPDRGSKPRIAAFTQVG